MLRKFQLTGRLRLLWGLSDFGWTTLRHIVPNTQRVRTGATSDARAAT